MMHAARFAAGPWLAAALLAGAGVAQAADIPVTWAIDAVSVSPDNARVTRRGTVALPAGTHVMVFGGLPGSINSDTLGFDAGSDTILVGAVETRRILSTDFVTEPEQQLRNELRDLQARRDSLQDEIATAETELKLLDSLATAPTGGGERPGVDAASLGTVLTTLSARSASARTRIREARARQREVADAITKVEGELKKVATERKATTEARIVVQTNAAARLSGSLSYQVEEAGWDFNYLARLDSAARKLRLESQGDVRQGTGEDWRNVELTLTTGRASETLEPEFLYSRFADLEVVEPPRPVVLQDGMETRTAVSAITAAPSVSEMVVTTRKREETSQIRTGYVTSFRVPGRTTVPSTREPKSFPVSSEDLAVELVARTVPLAEPVAYLQAVVPPTDELPFPDAGTLQLFLDGAFVGTTDFSPFQPEQSLRIPFGPDQRVRVAAIGEAEGSKDGSGLLNRNRRIEVRQRYEVTNLHSEPVTVELVDRVPVARNAAIRVDQPRESSPPTERDIAQQAGVHLWRSSLAPGEKMTVRNYYDISHPSDRELVLDEDD